MFGNEQVHTVETCGISLAKLSIKWSSTLTTSVGNFSSKKLGFGNLIESDLQFAVNIGA